MPGVAIASEDGRRDPDRALAAVRRHDGRDAPRGPPGRARGRLLPARGQGGSEPRGALPRDHRRDRRLARGDVGAGAQSVWPRSGHRLLGPAGGSPTGTAGLGPARRVRQREGHRPAPRGWPRRDFAGACGPGSRSSLAQARRSAAALSLFHRVLRGELFPGPGILAGRLEVTTCVLPRWSRFRKAGSTHVPIRFRGARPLCPRSRRLGARSVVRAPGCAQASGGPSLKRFAEGLTVGDLLSAWTEETGRKFVVREEGNHPPASPDADRSASIRTGRRGLHVRVDAPGGRNRPVGRPGRPTRSCSSSTTSASRAG